MNHAAYLIRIIGTFAYQLLRSGVQASDTESRCGSVMKLLYVSAFITVLATAATAVAQTDTDGDGLLDVLDVDGFDPDASDSANLDDKGIEDLDGVSQLTKASQINLNGNKLTVIDDGEFDGLTSLEELRLSGNQIMNIERGDFDGLTNLQHLRLAVNEITSIETGSFAGLSSLETLDLVGNRFPVIERGMLQGLDNLKTLYLGIAIAPPSQIASIENGAFEGLANLEALFIDRSQLTRIDNGDLAGLSNLQHLGLEYNQITSIECGAFKGLAELEVLELLSNRLTNIQAGAFDELASLQSLSLNSNTIAQLEPRSFEDLSSLRSLWVSRNEIATLASGTFEGLSGLESLGLEQNVIKSIEDGTFKGLASLENLDLRDNQITELNLTEAGFGSLSSCEGFFGFCIDSQTVVSLILNDAAMNHGSFNAIVSTTTSITDVSLAGLTFTDEDPADLSALLGIETLKNVTIGQELHGIYTAELEAFAAVDGNTLTIVAPDCNRDGKLDTDDLPCVSTIRERDRVLAALGTLAGDLDGNGDVDFDDFLRLSANFGVDSTSYANGNVDLVNGINFDDFLILSGNFGKKPGGIAAVPEPSSLSIIIAVVVVFGFRLRRCK